MAPVRMAGELTVVGMQEEVLCFGDAAEQEQWDQYPEHASLWLLAGARLYRSLTRSPDFVLHPEVERLEVPSAVSVLHRWTWALVPVDSWSAESL